MNRESHIPNKMNQKPKRNLIQMVFRKKLLDSRKDFKQYPKPLDLILIYNVRKELEFASYGKEKADTRPLYGRGYLTSKDRKYLRELNRYLEEREFHEDKVEREVSKIFAEQKQVLTLSDTRIFGMRVVNPEDSYVDGEDIQSEKALLQLAYS